MPCAHCGLPALVDPTTHFCIHCKLVICATCGGFNCGRAKADQGGGE